MRRLEHCPPTGAADLVKHGLRTGVAGAPVAQLLTRVLSAPQLPTADAEADVFGLEVFVGERRRVLPSLGRLSFRRPPLPAATDVSALVPAAAHLGSADATALRLLFPCGVADGLRRRPPAPTRDLDLFGAEAAPACVALVGAFVATGEDLPARLLAPRDIVFARLSRAGQQVLKGCLAAGAAGDDVGREWTVCRGFVLRMAGLLASMLPAVEVSPTPVVAVIRAVKVKPLPGPFLWSGRDPLTVIKGAEDVASLLTLDIFPCLPAVAVRNHRELAAPTEAGVAGQRALVLATGQQIATRFLAAPAADIVGVDTAPRGGVLSAEAGLGRAHQGTRLARPRVAEFGAGMGTPGSWFPARLSARVRRKAANGPRVELFAAPARVGAGVLADSRVAPGTPPRRGVAGLPGLLGVPRLIFVPFLDAVEVRDGPADGARPDLRRAHHLAGAYHALVLTVVDVLLDPCCEVGCCRL